MIEILGVRCRRNLEDYTTCMDRDDMAVDIEWVSDMRVSRLSGHNRMIDWCSVNIKQIRQEKVNIIVQNSSFLSHPYSGDVEST